VLESSEKYDDDIESMISNLVENMKLQGIVGDDDLEASLSHSEDYSKTECYICKMLIPLDEIFKDTEGCTYHAGCVYCKLCRTLLDNNELLKYNDELYCKRDYHVMKNRAKM
jgi:hypothetical protein